MSQTDADAAMCGILEQHIGAWAFGAFCGSADAVVVVGGDDGPAAMCCDGFERTAGFQRL